MTVRGVTFLIGAALAPLAQGADLLVSPDWLAAHLGDARLAVLHVGSAADYEQGHIPGARLLTLGDISITGERGLRLELPPAAALAAAFGKLGISDDTRIVLYAGTDSVQSATRAWFTLDYAGAGERASLLDGGLALWRAQGRPVTAEPPPPAAPAAFTVRPRPDLVVDAVWLARHLGDAGVAVLDARLPEFYTGANAGNMPRAGHIPGARNVPYTSLLDGSRRLKTPDELRVLLAAPAHGPVVSYCHIGQQATLLYFAARLVGLDARLYDGSFQDWSGRPDLPVEK